MLGNRNGRWLQVWTDSALVRSGRRPALAPAPPRAPRLSPTRLPACTESNCDESTADNVSRTIHILARSNTCSNSINTKEEAFLGRGAD